MTFEMTFGQGNLHPDRGNVKKFLDLLFPWFVATLKDDQAMIISKGPPSAVALTPLRGTARCCKRALSNKEAPCMDLHRMS
jgi:hypothetical protein